MSTRFILGVDIDEVTVQLHPAWLAKYNADYDDCLTPDDITHWQISEIVKPECGLKILDYLRHPDMYDTVEPVEGALEAIMHLQAQGHRVVFVSASNDVSAGSKIRCLQRLGFIAADDYKLEDVIIASDKALAAAGCDVLIDDAPHNLLPYVRKNRGAVGILFAAPHNASATDLPESVLRARDWTQVVEIVEWLWETATAPNQPAAEAVHTHVHAVDSASTADYFTTHASEIAQAVREAGENMPPETILQEAQRLVHGDRQASYGRPIHDYTRTGRMWGAILGIGDIDPRICCLMMAAMKISREVNAHKRDNLTDLAGYAECASMTWDDQQSEILMRAAEDVARAECEPEMVDV